jgi:hypothetical protein
MKKTFTIVLLAFCCSLISLAQPLNVLVLGATDSYFLPDVKNKLDGTNKFSTVEIWNISDSTPTVSYLEQYNAILLFTDDNAINVDVLGDAIGQYLDNGGGVVNAVFSNASLPIGGKFIEDYQVLLFEDQEDYPNLTLGEYDSDHILMSGITTFSGGGSAYRSTSTSITEGSTIVASWSDGKPLVIVNDDMGPAHVRRVDLNFFPVSSDAREDFWDSSTDGALLMANALEYVANSSFTSIKKSISASISDVYPNPTSGKFFLPVNSISNASYEVRIISVYGKEVFSNRRSFGVGLTTLEMDLDLDNGVYFVQILDKNASVSKKLLVE